MLVSEGPTRSAVTRCWLRAQGCDIGRRRDVSRESGAATMGGETTRTAVAGLRRVLSEEAVGTLLPYVARRHDVDCTCGATTWTVGGSSRISAFFSWLIALVTALGGDVTATTNVVSKCGAATWTIGRSSWNPAFL